jgi:hypothetical protein
MHFTRNDYQTVVRTKSTRGMVQLTTPHCYPYALNTALHSDSRAKLNVIGIKRGPQTEDRTFLHFQASSGI